MDFWRIPLLMAPMMYGLMVGSNGALGNMFPYCTNAHHSALHVGNNIQRVVDDDKKFGVTMDVSHFHPEELNVRVEGRELTIEGKQEHKTKKGFIHKAFVRKWLVPENVNLDAVKTRLNNKGLLSVEAPKLAREQQRRNIPIIPVTSNVKAEKSA